MVSVKQPGVRAEGGSRKATHNSTFEERAINRDGEVHKRRPKRYKVNAGLPGHSRDGTDEWSESAQAARRLGHIATGSRITDLMDLFRSLCP